MPWDKVIELGPDGKVRWEIKGLQNPRDAQVLPGGRVLIAEAYTVVDPELGARGTEREIDGKIVWEFKFKKKGTGRAPWSPANDCPTAIPSSPA